MRQRKGGRHQKSSGVSSNARASRPPLPMTNPLGGKGESKYSFFYRIWSQYLIDRETRHLSMKLVLAFAVAFALVAHAFSACPAGGSTDRCGFANDASVKYGAACSCIPGLCCSGKGFCGPSVQYNAISPLIEYCGPSCQPSFTSPGVCERSW